MVSSTPICHRHSARYASFIPLTPPLSIHRSVPNRPNIPPRPCSCLGRPPHSPSNRPHCAIGGPLSAAARRAGAKQRARIAASDNTARAGPCRGAVGRVQAAPAAQCSNGVTAVGSTRPRPRPRREPPTGRARSQNGRRRVTHRSWTDWSGVGESR